MHERRNNSITITITISITITITITHLCQLLLKCCKGNLLKSMLFYTLSIPAPSIVLSI